MNFAVYEILRASALKWPDRPAVYDAYGSISFQEVFDEAEALKATLIDNGLIAGMGLGLKAHNGRNFIIGLFAGLGCGAVVMPMSHLLKKAEMAQIFAETALHAVLFDSHGASPFEKPCTTIAMKQEAFYLGFTHQDPKKPFVTHIEHPALVRFTSGTTGKAKGVVLSHQSVIERIECGNRGLLLGSTDTVIWALPMAYHFVVSIVLYIRFGAAIAVAKDFMAQTIIDLTMKHSGTLLYAAPIQIRLMASHTGHEQITSLNTVISTSEAISPEICQAFTKRYKIDISQAYGIIEIGLPIINRIKQAEQPDAVGYALPDYTVDILDEHYQPLPPDTPGSLAIKGPGMFDGYLNPPCSRESVLKNGYFLTADYAVKRPDGLIKVLGRLQSVIHISGNKVFPEEVEGLLQTLPEIKQARIYPVPHALLGQIITAEIVLEPGATIEEEAVLTYCRKRLSTFKVPQKINIVDAIEMTGSGKIIRY